MTNILECLEYVFYLTMRVLFLSFVIGPKFTKNLKLLGSGPRLYIKKLLGSGSRLYIKCQQTISMVSKLN